MTLPVVITAVWWAVGVGVGVGVLVVFARLLREVAASAGRVDVALGVTVGILALGLRAAAPSSTFDIHLRSAEIFLGVDPEAWTYGVLHPATWWVLLPPGARDYTGLLWVHSVWSALVPVLLGAWMRTLGVGRAGAWTAAALTAVWGPLVGFGATDVQAHGEVVGLLTALLAWGVRDRWRWWWVALLPLVFSGGQRPEAAVVPFAFAASVWAAGDPVWGRRRDLAAWSAATAVVVLHLACLFWLKPGAFAPTAVGVGQGPPSPWMHGPSHWVALNPLWTPWPVVGAAVVGAMVGPGGRRRWVWPVVALTLGALVLDAGWAPVRSEVPAFLRHQLRSLPWFAALAGFAVDRVAGVRRDAGWAVGVGLVGALATTVPGWLVPRAIHGEFRVVREGLPEVPDGCTILGWQPPDDHGLALPTALSPIVGRDHRWIDLGREELPPDLPACTWWYRSGNCEVVVGGQGHDRPPPCAAWERRLGEGAVLVPRHVEDVPAGRWLYDAHEAATVRVGLYERVSAR